AKDKDSGFDVRKNLIGNLGDDYISDTKAPRGSSIAQLKSPPSLFLMASPNPEQLTAALKNIFVFMGQGGGAPTEREFLGRKIYSIVMPNMPLPMADAGKPSGPHTLNYTASGGYVAMSTDNSTLEEFLRAAETPPKAL